MRKYRHYRFSYVIIPRMDIPNSQLLNYITKTREPAAIIHIRQSQGKKDQILSFAKFFRFTIKVMFSPKPYKYTTSGRRNQVFQPFFPTVFRLYTLTFSRTGLCFIERQTSILIASSWQASYYCIRFIKKYRYTRAFDFSKQEKADKQEIGFYFVLYSENPQFCTPHKSYYEGAYH